MKCKDCNKEMQSAKVKSCTIPIICIEGEYFYRNTSYFDVNKRCHDCGIQNKKGNIHHGGCDMERCPKCGGQLISCACEHKDWLEILPFKKAQR